MRIALVVMTLVLVAYVLPAIAAGLFVGVLCGLIPYGVGRFWRRSDLGIAGFACCVVSGLTIGAILAVPVALIFAGLVITRSTSYRPGTLREVIIDEDGYPVDQ